MSSRLLLLVSHVSQSYEGVMTTMRPVNSHRLGKKTNYAQKFLRTIFVVLLIAGAIVTGCSHKPTGQHSERPNGSDLPSSSPTDGGLPGAPQPNGASTIGGQKDTPIDVNAMYGNPPMDANEAALAKKVKEALVSDPRITSKRIYVGVTHMYNGARRNDPVIQLAGSVASEDELTIVTNDLIKMKEPGWDIEHSLWVDRSQATQSPQSSQSGQVMDAPGLWSEPPDSDKPKIPLCPGLTVVTAIASQGDYESIKTIESVDAKQVRLKYSSETTLPWWEVPPARRNCEANTPGCAITTFVTHRSVLTADLESAHKYDQIFVTDKNSPETAPGTTAIGTSAAVLRELKDKGESEIDLCAGADDAPMMDDQRKLHPVPGGCFAWRSPMPIRRVGNQPARIRVLVDGTLVDLPAVQVLMTEYSGRRNEFFFLDDEQNPLTLKFRLGIGKVPALDPSTRQLCEAAKEKGNLSLGGEDPPSCDLPEGGDRDVLTVTKITTKCGIPRTFGNSGASTGVNLLEKALA